MSDTTTERTQSQSGSGEPGSNRFANTQRNDFAAALFEASKPKTSERPNVPPTSGERDTTASTPPTPEGEPEREGSSVEPQQSDKTEKPEDTAALTPEERSRREEQSFKDKYYAEKTQRESIEADRIREKVERETYEEQQRLSQMDRVEADSYQRFQSQVKPMEQHAWDLHNRAETARQEGDIELANYFENTKTQMVNAIQMQYGSYNQWAQMNRQQVFSQKQSAQEKQLSRTLAKAGLTLDELKADNPKLDTSNPFAVIEAVSTASQKKQEARYKSDIETAKNEAKEAKQKWRTDSPASVPDRTLTGKKPDSNRGGRGNASADLAQGLFGSKKK